MNAQPLPTVRRLASLAGVSRTTVSLALRNHPSLSDGTRVRVQKLAAALGYKQDPVVASLMAQLRTSRARRSVERIAYFTTWDTREGWKKPGNESNYYKGACERAGRLGYEIEHIWAREPGITPLRLGKILQTRAIRGILIAPFSSPRSHITMEWNHFATAAISHTLARPLVHRASHGHSHGMFLALHNLWRRGYRRVGFATRKEQDERVAGGWLAALLIHQQSIPADNRIPPFLPSCPPETGLAGAGFRDWMRRHRPDVIVSNLAEVMEILADMKLRVPEDIGYASIDLADKTTPWSGVDQQAADVGAAAVDLVVTSLQNNEFGLPTHPKTVNLDGVWRDGDTLLPRIERPPATPRPEPRKRPGPRAVRLSALPVAARPGREP